MSKDTDAFLTLVFVAIAIAFIDWLIIERLFL
jgi:hypothetical protein